MGVHVSLIDFDEPLISAALRHLVALLVALISLIVFVDSDTSYPETVPALLRS